MTNNEATARIKINKLLESSGWRFFAEGGQPANIALEAGTQITSLDLDAFGENFEKTRKGFIDFLLLNEKGSPFIVLEAKAGDLDPLVGKEQARDYAKSQKCRFVILSNGNLHYFWDLERGNPEVLAAFPTPSSVMGYQKDLPKPDRQKLVIAKHQTLMLNREDSELFVEAVLNPPLPNEALKAAAIKYKQTMRAYTNYELRVG